MPRVFAARAGIVTQSRRVLGQEDHRELRQVRECTALLQGGIGAADSAAGSHPTAWRQRHRRLHCAPHRLGCVNGVFFALMS